MQDSVDLNQECGSYFDSRYILPREYMHTSLEEVIGGVLKEEVPNINWWRNDDLYKEDLE